MSVIFLILMLANPGSSIYLKKVDRIKIDGIEDAAWFLADSAFVESMSEPYYGEKATYIAKVKALQDKNNLYFLFRIEYDSIKPDTRLSGRPDRVDVYLDPLFSKIEAYWFSVTLANERDDGLITGDGENFDISWDGVWDSKAKVFKRDGKYIAVVEIRIPFKTLKFKRDISTWGINFRVSYETLGEEDWWILPPENTNVKVSEFGLLKNVKPGEGGMGIELYPVLLTKKVYSTYLGLDKYSVKTGLDLKYKKGSFSLSTTLFPDFAEIEADPYTMTLGRTEIYYSEKRPFFLEGREIFVPSMSLFNPVQVFYSRRIGKKFTDVAGEVPVILGIKAINKGKRDQFGALGVLTGRLEGTYDTAHYTIWNAWGARHTLGNNSDIGIIGAYKRDIENDSAFYAVSIDGTARKRRSSLSWQLVLNKSDSGAFGMAFQAGGIKYIKRWYFIGFEGDMVSSRFNVSPVGYTTLFPGHKGITILLGKYGMGKFGSSLRTYSGNISGILYKDPEDPQESYGAQANLSAQFQRPLRMGFYLNGGFHREFTKDTLERPYFTRFGSLFMWMRIKSTGVHFSTNWAYSWNYLRGYRAKSIYTKAGIHFPLFTRLEGEYSISAWSEYRPDGSYRGSTLSGVAEFTYHFTPFMELSVQNNHVITHDTVFEPQFARLSVYYSWEIKPKSRLYLVINRLFRKNGTQWESPEFLYAFKVRYLFLI